MTLGLILFDSFVYTVAVPSRDHRGAFAVDRGNLWQDRVAFSTLGDSRQHAGNPQRQGHSLNTSKGLMRSLAQAQVCERKRGRSLGASASHQVGDGILIATESLPQARQSRFYEEIEIDPETGEPREVVRK